MLLAATVVVVVVLPPLLLHQHLLPPMQLASHLQALLLHQHRHRCLHPQLQRHPCQGRVVGLLLLWQAPCRRWRAAAVATVVGRETHRVSTQYYSVRSVLCTVHTPILLLLLLLQVNAQAWARAAGGGEIHRWSSCCWKLHSRTCKHHTPTLYLRTWLVTCRYLWTWMAPEYPTKIILFKYKQGREQKGPMFNDVALCW